MVLLPKGKHALCSYLLELYPALKGQQLAASAWGHTQSHSPSEGIAFFPVMLQLVVEAKRWCWTKHAECMPASVPWLPSLLLPAAFTSLTSFQLLLLPTSRPVNHSLSHPQISMCRAPSGAQLCCSWDRAGPGTHLFKLCRNNWLLCPDLTKTLEEAVASSRPNPPQTASFLLACRTRTITEVRQLTPQCLLRAREGN